MAGPKVDYIGRTNGRLTVIEFSHMQDSHINKKGIMQRNSFWKCKCICGNEKIINSKRLKPHLTKSCGCLQKEITSKKFSVPRPEKRTENSPLRRIFTRYKAGAISRNLEFNLSESEFSQIITKNCYYCNTSPSNTFNYYGRKYYYGSITYNGIDRKDNKKGYLVENCLPCCEICNKAKLDYDYEVFIEWINKLKNYNIV